uniref:Uncharacterized protein n=1 Tax=viral metagenome TaxID=1070528 RepID=A0A6C0CIQ8_9ZZZZ
MPSSSNLETLGITFDFDVLKNIFYYDENGPQAEIGDFGSILKMTIKFDLVPFTLNRDSRAKQVIERVTKYKKRGFKFVQ